MRIAILTAPRPRPTLAESIGSMRRAGFMHDTIVCSDGGDPVISDGVFNIRNEVRLGNKLNWDRALSLLLVHCDRDDDWVMVCEDDIVWQAGAAAELERDLERLDEDDVGALSLFAPRRVTRGHALEPGWHHEGMQHGPKTWGAQCLVMSAGMGHRLQNDRLYRGYMSNRAMDKNIDLIVGASINNAGRKILYRIPCLVDHIGYGNSSLGYKDERPNLLTDYFRGPRA